MKLQCTVIQDLLPLYKDAVCSEESKALVEVHLQECALCTKQLQLMQNDALEQDIEEQSDNAFENLKTKVKKKNRKKIWIAATAAVMLAGALVSLFYWKFDVQTIKMRDVTQARAVTVMPTVIITGEEYALAGKLLQSKDIQAAIERKEPAVTLDESVRAEFFDQIHVNGQPVDSVSIEVIGETVYFDYMVDNCIYYLGFSSADYITKTAAQYKKNMDVKYAFENQNNTTYKEYYSVRDWFPKT